MKYYLIAICLFCSLSLRGEFSDLSLARNSFYSATITSEVCEKVYKKIKDSDYSHEPIMQGYKGVYQIIMAKHTWNPFAKWSYFHSGVRELENAIAKKRNNIELIFLRFSIQTNSPSFLGYNKNIKSDKAFIMQSLMNEKMRYRYRHFLRDTINYLVHSPFFSEKEKSILRKLEFNES